VRKSEKREPVAASGTAGSSKHLLDRLPHLHRPTKEELLAAATGFWHRLQIRFKWFSIRSVRPYNAEEIFAFISWIFWAHVLWVVIGTTTFVSLAILALNTVFAQETLAGWVGQYLTKNTGIKVVFENAIVPRWGSGVIRLNNVFVSRRRQTDKSKRSVTKGSSTTAAAVAAAEAKAEREKKDGYVIEASTEQEDDGNYTQFDVTIESVEVTLSFAKWFNGKGLLRDVEIRGVRGVLDRTSVQPRAGDEDPKSYRHEHHTGDFEIDNFKMEDVLLTVYQPNDFRPFQVSVFSCELPRLRKQWLFYDFLSANNMSGSFDNSLFTIHPRQVHSTTGMPLAEGKEEQSSQWKKHSRIRLDGLKIDHLNRGVDGPFSWIYEGNVDIVADLMIPTDADGSIVKVMSDIFDRVEATVTNQAQNGLSTVTHGHAINNHDEDSSEYAHTESESQAQSANSDDDRFLVMDIQIHLNDVRAHVPIFTRDLSYVNSAAVRPIVAYINSHSHRSNDFIPISCRIVKRQSEFDGSWTIFDSGLLDDLSKETYEAFAKDITDRKQRQRRMKKVGLWAAQIAAQALFLGLAGQLA
jgi:distribution and morphology protein 31